ALAGQPTGETVLSIHVATDAEVDAALQEAARAGGGGGQGGAPPPLGGSYGFFADPDGHLWEIIRHPLYQLGTDGRPEIPSADFDPGPQAPQCTTRGSANRGDSRTH